MCCEEKKCGEILLARQRDKKEADHERRVMAQCQQTEPETVKDVDHARHAGVLPGGDHSLPVRVNHFLVVDQANVLSTGNVSLRNICTGKPVTLSRMASSKGMFASWALIVCEKKQ